MADTLLQQQRVQIVNQRDKLIYELDLKYSHYINTLLQQKFAITAQITNQYDQLIKNFNNSVHNNLSINMNNLIHNLETSEPLKIDINMNSDYHTTSNNNNYMNTHINIDNNTNIINNAVSNNIPSKSNSIPLFKNTSKHKNKKNKNKSKSKKWTTDEENKLISLSSNKNFQQIDWEQLSNQFTNRTVCALKGRYRELSRYNKVPTRVSKRHSNNSKKLKKINNINVVNRNNIHSFDSLLKDLKCIDNNFVLKSEYISSKLSWKKRTNPQAKYGRIVPLKHPCKYCSKIFMNAYQLKQHISLHTQRPLKWRKWRVDEENKLRSLTSNKKEINWQNLSLQFSNRSAAALYNRYLLLRRTSLKQTKWTPDEENQLILLTLNKKRSEINWENISVKMQNRTPCALNGRYLLLKRNGRI